jgi:hypothetical protein
MFTQLPSKEEMAKILSLRSSLQSKEHLLFRLIKDVQSEQKTSQDCLDYFQTVANAVHGISKLKSLTYYLYLSVNTKDSNKGEFIKSLSNYLIQGYFIRSTAESNQGLNNNTRFDNVGEGIRWVLAYRVAKAIITERIREMDETSTPHKDI